MELEDLLRDARRRLLPVPSLRLTSLVMLWGRMQVAGVAVSK
jgi:hypothetical protein